MNPLQGEGFTYDYGIAVGPKHASSLAPLKGRIKDGAPIHGVGIQGHGSTAGIPDAALLLECRFGGAARRRAAFPDVEQRIGH